MKKKDEYQISIFREHDPQSHSFNCDDHHYKRSHHDQRKIVSSMVLHPHPKSNPKALSERILSKPL